LYGDVVYKHEVKSKNLKLNQTNFLALTF